MTNEEKYKTTDERVYAFRKHCRDKGTCHDCVLNETGVSRTMGVDRCILNWLALEAEETPLPCPFCGEAARVFTMMDGNVLCGYEVHCKGCWASACTCNSKADAIAAWNRRAGGNTGSQNPH